MIFCFFLLLVSSARRVRKGTNDVYPEFVERKIHQPIDLKNPANINPYSDYKQILDQLLPVFSQLKIDDVQKHQKKQLKALIIKELVNKGIDLSLPDSIGLLTMAQRKIGHARQILKKLNKK